MRDGDRMKLAGRVRKPDPRMVALSVAGALVLATLAACTPGPAAPVGLATASSTLSSAQASTRIPAPEPHPRAGADYTFVAAPDFLNQDVGDVTTRPGWDPGEPNSWTQRLQTSIDVFLDEIKAQRPSSVLVAGDLVEGHWFSDIDHTGIFGPSRTPAQKSHMLRNAGNFYEDVWAQRFADRDLVVHAAVGDHDIGDNPWSGSSSKMRFKRSQIPAMKRLFAHHFTDRPSGAHRYRSRPRGTPWEGTAYSVHLSPDILLVTLDVFHQTPDGIRVEVVGGQLRWLEHVLRAAKEQGTKWIIVQGHTPIAVPVRTRSSSGLELEHGTRSEVWQLFAKYGVDMYLCGEVHDTTVRRAGGVTQVSTGGLLYKGEATYMTGRVYGRRMALDVREFDYTRGRGPQLWQLGAYRTKGVNELQPGSHSVGTLTLTSDGRVLRETGKLAPYHR